MQAGYYCHKCTNIGADDFCCVNSPCLCGCHTTKNRGITLNDENFIEIVGNFAKRMKENNFFNLTDDVLRNGYIGTLGDENNEPFVFDDIPTLPLKHCACGLHWEHTGKCAPRSRK